MHINFQFSKKHLIKLINNTALIKMIHISDKH
jgi:hypothetical protein